MQYAALCCFALAAAGCGFEHGARGALGDDDAATGGMTGSDAAIVHDAAVDAKPDASPDARPDAAPATPVTVDLLSTQDTYVDSVNPTTNFGTGMAALTDAGSQPATALFRFDVSTIPATATVQAVTLHIWTGGDAGDPVNVYEMLEAWSESQATWNQRSNGTAWTGTGATGGSHGATSLATLAADTTYTERMSAISATVVQGWVTTAATNYGIAIVSSGSNGSTWRTREDTTTTHRPYLHITYLP